MLLTKMEVSILMTAQDLRHHVKNLTGLAGSCLGQSSAIHIALRLLVEYIEDNENEYNYEFRQESLFGGHFLDKIHWRIHKFFNSCARGDEEKIDLGNLTSRKCRTNLNRGIGSKNSKVDQKVNEEEGVQR